MFWDVCLRRYKVHHSSVFVYEKLPWYGECSSDTSLQIYCHKTLAKVWLVLAVNTPCIGCMAMSGLWSIQHCIDQHRWRVWLWTHTCFNMPSMTDAACTKLNTKHHHSLATFGWQNLISWDKSMWEGKRTGTFPYYPLVW